MKFVIHEFKFQSSPLNVIIHTFGFARFQIGDHIYILLMFILEYPQQCQTFHLLNLSPCYLVIELQMSYCNPIFFVLQVVLSIGDDNIFFYNNILFKT